MAFKEINNIFDKYFDCLDSQSFNTFTRFYLGLRYGKKDRMVEQLHHKNIMESRHSECINDVFLKIFDNLKCDTAGKIINVLVGEKQKSKLHLSDFEHIKDTEKVINIFTQSVKQKRRGVNILLYGGIGTGKTEYSKLIANTANIPVFGYYTAF